MVRKHSQLVVAMVGLLDLAVATAAWLVAYAIRFRTGWIPYVGVRPPGLRYMADPWLLTLLLVLLIFSRFGLYSPRRIQTLAAELFDLIKACVVVWVLEVAISHFLRQPRMSIILQVVFLATWLAMMVAYRGSARAALRWFRRRGKNTRTAAIVGVGRLGQKLRHTLRKAPWTGYSVQYFIADQRTGESFLGAPVYGPIADTQEIIDRYPVDAVFVALSRHRSRQLEEVLEQVSADIVDVNVVPDMLSYHYMQHRMVQFGALPIINLTHSPQSGWNATVKRVMDVAFSLLGLIVLAPLMVLIALAIKLTSRGPVLFTQKRASLGGKEFRILKFRSMVDGADRDAKQWSTSTDDPRITPIGRFLRKFSLDELPQLINVLIGDMSLVGPRPELPEHIERFRHTVPRYMLRHHVRSGITGWAQVNGYRGRTSLRKRIQYDLDYINNWSLAFDLRILLLTVFRGFVHPQEDV